jgi:hypothetical protein
MTHENITIPTVLRRQGEHKKVVYSLGEYRAAIEDGWTPNRSGVPDGQEATEMNVHHVEFPQEKPAVREVHHAPEKKQVGRPKAK